MKQRYCLLLSIALFISVVLGTFMPAQTQASVQLATAIKPELNIDIPTITFSDAVATQDDSGKRRVVPYIGEYLSGIYTYGAGLLALVAVLVILFAGVRWITAAGNKKTIDDAKEMIQHALLGLVIVLGSYTILWVIDPELTKFKAINLSYVEPIELEFSDETEADGAAAASGTVDTKASTTGTGSPGPVSQPAAPASQSGPVPGSLSGFTMQMGAKTVIIPNVKDLPVLYPNQAPPGYPSIDAFNKAMSSVAAYFGTPEKNATPFCDLKKGYASTSKLDPSYKGTYWGSLDCAGNSGPRKSGITTAVLHTAEGSAKSAISTWRHKSVPRYVEETIEKQVPCAVGTKGCPKKGFKIVKEKTGKWVPKKSGVASHFYIGPDGVVEQMGDVNLIYSHCCSNNPVSVGIDLKAVYYKFKDPAHAKNEKLGGAGGSWNAPGGFWWYTPKQYKALNGLLAKLKAKGATNVISHCSGPGSTHHDPPFFSFDAIGVSGKGNDCAWEGNRKDRARAARDELQGPNLQKNCPECAQYGVTSFAQMCPQCPI